jgi:PAS domain S-box-containing protein
VEDRLRAAFDDSFVAQIILSPSGEIQEVNYQACRVLHRSREELCKLHHRDITTDEGLELFEGLAQNFDKKHLVNWQTEQKYLRSNGFIFWANVSVSAIRKNQQIVGLLLQLQDITELRRAEGALQRNNEDLEQFVYIASHDLREPLTSVAGYAGLLTRRLGDKLDDEEKHYLSEILDSAKRMEQKIDDLLSFSRAGRSGVIQGTFHLGAAIEEARRNLVRRIEEASALFEVQDDLPNLQGDRGLIAQVFQNLFSNSIKYHGTETPRISIQAELYDDNFWLITVKDNGIGFDMQHKDRIFGVFQRLYTIEEYPGTGIGLAIAKKIVERHLGRIWTLSSPGKGSAFFFTLPSAPQT